jgi:enediyne biosynthesis protein E4
MRNVKNFFFVACTSILFCISVSAETDRTTLDKCLSASQKTIDEAISARSSQLPANLVRTTVCVGILPGAESDSGAVMSPQQQGVLVCQWGHGWGAPAFIQSDAGVSARDPAGHYAPILFFVIGNGGFQNILKDQFQIANVTAEIGESSQSRESSTGPLAESSGLLAYSLSAGHLNRVDLRGSTIRQDREKTQVCYGTRQTFNEVLQGGGANPGGTSSFMRSLTKWMGSLRESHPTTPDVAPLASQEQLTPGMATGGSHPPQLDVQLRPITAGGFVKAGPVVFRNIAEQAGLTRWHHIGGSTDKRFILEAKGPGVALLDYDNDGWLDIYFVNGTTYDALDGKTVPPHSALFHNNHDGTFTDVTQMARVANDRWGYGAVVGDYDNDGWPDIFVSNYGKNRLYHNNHDGTFTDDAEKAGVTLGNWSTAATFGDYDGDGHLDLFVAGYVHYDVAHPPIPETRSAASGTCQYRGQTVLCGPRGLPGEPDHLFHNNGDGTFTDVSEKAGVGDRNGYYALGALFVDVNNDDKPDLLVANDSTPNYLYINMGDGTFEDKSLEYGYAVAADGHETASMGIAAGDYENNGHMDIVNTTFSDDYKVVYQNDGTGNFTDVSLESGVATPSIPFVSFGDGFLDYDNDGWKDLFIANGHVYPVVDKFPEWGSTYAERPLLYHNLKNGKFEVIPPVEGTGLAVVSVGRGAAFGDLFNDGRIDVVISNMDGVPALLRNVNPDHHHWVELKLVGGPKSPRDAVGAAVYLTAGGIRQRGDVLSGGSYLSSNDLRVHFGLNESSVIDEIEIHWPSGQKEKITLPSIDRIFTVQEGKGVMATP